MKWLGALFLFIVLTKDVIAQQTLMDRLPGCAVTCFETTLPVTKCSSDNIGCLCADQNFMTAAAACNAVNCTVVESLKSTNETYAACGIPLRSQSNTMIGVTASIGGLAVVMVAMRLVDRGLSTNSKLGWDDLLIGLSGFSSLLQNVPVIVAGRLGFGRDIWGIPPGHITASLKWLYVTYFMYQVAEALCQLSICAFYLRLMVNRYQRITVWVLIVIVTCFGLGNTFSMAFQCWPIPFFWNGWRADTKGQCTVNIRLFGFIRGGVEICLDLVILSLPLPMLAKLQMSMKKKLQIMSMFCVGFVITVVSCLRLNALIQFAQTKNPTYDNTPGVYWCVTEANLFIVVACMPAMRSILQKALPSCFGSVQDSYGGSTGNKGSSSGAGKGSYIRSPDKPAKSSGSLPFGVITKSMDVEIYRTDRSERSESDVELVDRPAQRPGKVTQDSFARSWIS